MHRIVQQIQAIDDHRSGSHAFYYQQYYAVPGILFAQIESLGHADREVEPEGANVEEEQDPARPAHRHIPLCQHMIP